MADYSHSKLSTFESCRCKYKIHYIDGIWEKEEKSIETFLGSVVHMVLEKLYADIVDGKCDTIDVIREYYDALWEEGYVDTLKINKKHMAAENYHSIGWIYIESYYKSHEPFDDMEILALETQDILELSNGRTYDIRIDKLARVGKEYYICDYKTDNHMKTKREADIDRQLAMYSIWVKQNYPDAERIHLLWHMLRFDRDVESERTDEQLKDLMDGVVRTINDIEGCVDWTPNVTMLCNYCDVKKHCPEFK